MRKKLTVVICTLVVMILIALITFVKLFPLADDLRLPTLDKVYYISITLDDLILIEDEIEVRRIMNVLNTCKPTRTISMNEHPVGIEYYVLNLKTESEIIYQFYIYEDNQKWKLESPYEGVYNIDFDLIIEILN